ncbi:MAG: RDD family protein [Paracoccaceae bacterium]
MQTLNPDRMAAAQAARVPATLDPDTAPEFFAGVRPKRAAAWLIDATAVGLMSLALLPFTAFLGLLVFPLFVASVGFVYRWVTLRNRSATWGMRMMAIELREGDGRRISDGTAFLHTAAYVGAWVVLPAQFLSVFLMAGTRLGQGLGDLTLNTVMVNR